MVATTAIISGVAVADVGHLVGQHRRQLLAVEDAADAGGDGHCGVVGAAAGGEGVGRLGVNLVHLRHGQPGEPGLLAHDAVQLGVIALGNRVGLGHAEGNLVAEPVSSHVHDQGEDQRNHDACLAADDSADEDKHHGEYHHQNECLERVHLFFLWSCLPGIFMKYEAGE